MCKCGCNTCETKITGPLLTESKIKSLLSENLQFHIKGNIPLCESKLELSKKSILLKEAKKLYSRYVLDLSEGDLKYIGENTLPTQDQVSRFFSLTQNETHYLNSKPVAGQEKTFNNTKVEPWDEYDLSNWNSLVRKAKAKGKISEKLKGLDGKACWKGYKLAGTKKKGGKTVDNCVPMEEDIATKDEVLDLIARKNFDKDFKDLSEVEADFVKGEAKKRNLDEEDMDINELMEMEIIDENITEAKYQGKTVTLNKPTRGDSKKFKVYVNSGKKNADGSIKVKKVNFGHGGTSAKRPTMSIRKSNPKRRKAFRSRFNCDSPGPKTMARYWSCKAW